MVGFKQNLTGRRKATWAGHRARTHKPSWLFFGHLSNPLKTQIYNKPASQSWPSRYILSLNDVNFLRWMDVLSYSNFPFLFSSLKDQWLLFKTFVVHLDTALRINDTWWKECDKKTELCNKIKGPLSKMVFKLEKNCRHLEKNNDKSWEEAWSLLKLIHIWFGFAKLKFLHCKYTHKVYVPPSQKPLKKVACNAKEFLKDYGQV